MKILQGRRAPPTDISSKCKGLSASCFTFGFVCGVFESPRVQAGTEKRHQGELFDLLFVG